GPGVINLGLRMNRILTYKLSGDAAPASFLARYTRMGSKTGSDSRLRTPSEPMRRKKHDRYPSWHAPPTWRALIRITSPSQSSQMDSTCWMCPEVAPLCQCERRERE